MRPSLLSITRLAFCGGLLSLLIAAPTLADDKVSAKKQDATNVPEVDLLQALQRGQVTVKAEGSGDGRMTLSVTNRTKNPLRVVLPPGLIAAGATGQFGGMGGMGGMGMMGGGMGGMGGGMGMMGGGMGGMGGGMGGMMGGGMGGMGGGMGGMGGGMGMMGGGMGGRGGGMLTMPPQMGMMMLARLIMMLCGDRDSWDYSSLMMGMGGMGGMGMMGGGMGMMGGGMGGMGGGMMGGMGGMMRSVPPTGLPHATLQPGQTRHLPTRLVSLNGPDQGQVRLPDKGEPLEIGDISQLTPNAKIDRALKRLAAEKAPPSVAQLVMWNVASGLNWDQIRALSQRWANSQEMVLAQRFVERLESDEKVSPTADSGRLYWDVAATSEELKPLAEEMIKLLDGKIVLGLNVEKGAPERPESAALACRVQLSGSKEKPEAQVSLSASDSSGGRWTQMGKFTLPLAKEKTGELKAEQIADATAEGLLSRLVRAQLAKGPRDKGKPTFRIRIDNASPLVLNGVVLTGMTITAETKPTGVAGISLPPRRSLTLGATSEVVDRLGLKNGIRVVAVDLSGL